MLSTGVRAWMLCMELKTNPPPGAKTAQRSRTCRRTSSGVPNGSTFWVSMPPPQNVMRLPNSFLSPSAPMPAAEHCTGLRISKPASMNEGMNFDTAPQLCLKVRQVVWR